MNKKEYSDAVIDVIVFQSVDIITASGNSHDPDDTDWGGGQRW